MSNGINGVVTDPSAPLTVDGYYQTPPGVPWIKKRHLLAEVRIIICGNEKPVVQPSGPKRIYGSGNGYATAISSLETLAHALVFGPLFLWTGQDLLFQK